jgi:hypothetical protein
MNRIYSSGKMDKVFIVTKPPHIINLHPSVLKHNKVKIEKLLLKFKLLQFYTYPDSIVPYHLSTSVLTPSSIAFTPFNLNKLNFPADFWYNQIDHDSFGHDLLREEGILRNWVNVNTDIRLNTLKLCVTKCIKNITRDPSKNCNECRTVKIGIYKVHGNNRNQCIFVSLREAQFLIIALIRFVELCEHFAKAKETFSEFFADAIVSRSSEFQDIINSNGKPPPRFIFHPVNFYELGIKPDFCSLMKAEIPLHKTELRTILTHQQTVRSRMSGRLRTHSLSFFPFSPSPSGPFMLGIYKDTKPYEGCMIYVSVYETQHLIHSLIQLVATGVGLHIASLESESPF